MPICKHGKNAPDHILDDLHIGQEGPQRHKCAECAFDAGSQYGHQNSVAPVGNAECTYMGKRAPKDVIDALPESQAGKGRHKCAVCAYHAGFESARAQAIGKQIGDGVTKTISDTLADLKKKPD
jgi:hypothetical protein